VRDRHTDVSTEQTFDALMVSSGHHADAYKPRFSGDDTFKGKILHSHDYRHFSGFEGKRVIVVGIGNSGLDVSVELSYVCSQVSKFNAMRLLNRTEILVLVYLHYTSVLTTVMTSCCCSYFLVMNR
jgi:thioredoxin reductase